MNILILISSLSYGGAEKQAVIDANLLSKNHNVFLCTFNGGPQKQHLFNEVKYIEIGKDSYISTAKKISSLVKESKIDLMQCSLFAPMIIGGISAFYHKKPVIWTFHSHEYDIPFKSRISLFLLSNYKRIIQILFVNNELRSYFLKHFYFPPAKTKVLYNSTQYHKIPDNLKNTIKSRGKQIITIGYIGRVIELKRVHYLINLAVFLKGNGLNFKIVIVGDGETLSSIKSEATYKGVIDFFSFHGFQAYTASYYKSFDIFINPSREECLSVALIDAGIYGIPSIAFNVGGNKEIIIHEKTGFIVRNEEELFKKTKLLMLQQELRKNLGIAAQKHCLSLFSQTEHLKVMEEIYFNAINNSYSLIT